MKQAIALLYLLFVCLSVKAQTATTQPAKAAYSQIWQPISSEEIRAQVRLNSRNSVALHQLWWRARTQGGYWYFVQELNRLIPTQPNNAAALAAYSNALLDCVTVYSRSPAYSKAKADLGDDLSMEGVRKRLNQAKKLNPKEWLIYAVEAEIGPYEEGNLEQLGRRSELLARRAISLKNNSITNSVLVHVLVNRASWDNKPRYIDQAVVVAKRAQKMTPAYPQASAFLLRIYKNERKNPLEVRKAEQAILATIPPQLKISDKASLYLKQLGINN